MTESPESRYRTVVETPVGNLVLTTSDTALLTITWTDEAATEPSDPVSRETVNQLNAYFAGDLTEFSLPCQPDGTDLVKEVCAAMQTIPFGEVWTYGQMARHVGSEPRAVGNACGQNPIPVVIPCHRVVGGGGKLTGFSGGSGVETKARLLALEKANGQLL